MISELTRLEKAAIELFEAAKEQFVGVEFRLTLESESTERSGERYVTSYDQELVVSTDMMDIDFKLTRDDKKWSLRQEYNQEVKPFEFIGYQRY